MNTKRVVAVICVVLVLVLILGLVATALATSQSQVDALKQQQAAIAEQKKALGGQINDLQGEMENALVVKTALDEQNELARQEIELINEQIALYEDMIETKARELEEAKKVEAEQKEALRVRMRAMEESGSLSYISILFKATSFTDLLSRLDSINMIMQRDKQLEDAYIAAREHVEVVKAEYEATLAEHESTKIELEAKKAALEAEIKAAEVYIDELENDIERYKKEFAAKEAEEAAIDAQVKSALAAMEAQRQQGDTSYITGTGTYKWPCPGYPGGSSYGWRMHPIFHENRFHAGTDIGAPTGTAIYAADSGTVAIATYSSSYGNYVVINHGNGRSTLYAHQSAMAVSVGQNVNQGDVIGYVGSTGWSTGPHLHFEVRVNGTATDPLSYSYF